MKDVTFGSSLPELAKRANKFNVVRSYVPGREISNHVISPIVHKKETLGASLGALYSRMVGMTNPTNGMPTNAALFPNSVDATRQPTRMDFGNFLATGPVGAAYAPSPYGIAIAKDTKLAPAIKAALVYLIKNGTYGQIFKKWGVQSIAIPASKVKINGALS